MPVKKKVSGMGEIILPVGVLVLGYFVLQHFGLLGPSANDQNNAGAAAANKAATDKTASDQAAKGIAATMSADTAAGIASQIYTLGISGGDVVNYANQVENLLMQANNLTDLNMIIAAFGTKTLATSSSIFNSCSVLGISCTAMDLAAFVRLIDTAYQGEGGESLLSSVNSYYTLQGINYQF